MKVSYIFSRGILIDICYNKGSVGGDCKCIYIIYVLKYEFRGYWCLFSLIDENNW